MAEVIETHDLTDPSQHGCAIDPADNGNLRQKVGYERAG